LKIKDFKRKKEKREKREKRKNKIAKNRLFWDLTRLKIMFIFKNRIEKK